MKRHPRGKIKLTVYIDDQLRDELDAYISRKYATPYGALSEVVENALSKYMSSEDPTHTSTHKKAPKRSHEAAIEICREIWDSGSHFEFLRRHLIEAIEKTRGMDDRTIMKWHKFLVKHKYVVLARPPHIYRFGPASGMRLDVEEEASK